MVCISKSLIHDTQEAMNTTKFKIALASIAVAAFALAGCGTTKTEKSTPTVPAPTTSTTFVKQQTTTTLSSTDVLTEAYIVAMREYFPNTSRSTLLDLGKTACLVIRTQGSVMKAMTAIANDPSFRGMEEAVGYTFGVAVPVFCPEYLPELKRIIGS